MHVFKLLQLELAVVSSFLNLNCSPAIYWVYKPFCVLRAYYQAAAVLFCTYVLSCPRSVISASLTLSALIASWHFPCSLVRSTSSLKNGHKSQRPTIWQAAFAVIICCASISPITVADICLPHTLVYDSLCCSVSVCSVLCCDILAAFWVISPYSVNNLVCQFFGALSCCWLWLCISCYHIIVLC